MTTPRRYTKRTFKITTGEVVETLALSLPYSNTKI